MSTAQIENSIYDPNINELLRTEASPLSPKDDKSIRDGLEYITTDLITLFNKHIPPNINKDRLAESVRSQLVFIDGSRMIALAEALQAIDEQQATVEPNPQGIYIPEYNIMAIGVPEHEEIAQYITLMDAETRSSLQMLYGDDLETTTRGMIIAKTLVHELMHRLQNLDEVDLSMQGMRAFVECAVEFYSQRYLRSKETPFFSDSRKKARYQEYETLLKSFDEDTLMDVLMGNKPRVGLQSSYRSPEVARLNEYNRTKHQLQDYFNEKKSYDLLGDI